MEVQIFKFAGNGPGRTAFCLTTRGVTFTHMRTLTRKWPRVFCRGLGCGSPRMDCDTDGDQPPQSAPWAAASLCAVCVALWTGSGPQRPLQRSGSYQHLVSDSSVAFFLSLGHAAGAWRAGYAGGEGGGQGCAGRCGMAPKTQVTRAARHCVVSWLFKSPLKCSNFCSVSSLREPPMWQLYIQMRWPS